MFPADVQRDLTDDECNLHFVLFFKKKLKNKNAIWTLSQNCVYFIIMILNNISERLWNKTKYNFQNIMQLL